MLCPGDNFLLVMPVQVDEVIAVTGNPHQQVAILIGYLLGPAQGGGVHHIELDVMAVQVEIGSDKMSHAVDPGLSLQNAGGKSLV